ncbi:MAG: AAA family ATPase [FCB group bacterium]|nr:AAA family ATPase [FCB group bacterium]MBL7027442.1 AAA family ATPase [Candidatus Neomarinimicrobiota bacterium]
MSKTIRELYHDYMATSDKSQREVALAVGVSDTRLSQWANDKYPGSNEKIEEMMEMFLSREFTRQNNELEENFVHTSQATEMTRIFNYCHTFQDMGAIYGSPGWGKTITSQEYLRNHPDVILLAAVKGFTRNAILLTIAQHLGMVSHLTGYRQFGLMVKALKGTDRLLILDESQFLGNDSLEVIRSLHDQSGIGVVYVGQPSLHRRMMNEEAEFFAQITSRLGVKLILDKPEFEDMKLIAESFNVMDSAIHEYLWDVVTRDSWGGSYRRMAKLLKLAIRTSARTKQDISIPFLKDVGRYMVHAD